MKNSKKSNKSSPNRRRLPREKDRFFQTMVAINVLGWLAFLGALLVFHDARPEFVTGVQAFWGIQGRDEWSKTLSMYLVGLLVTCVVISLIVLVMKRQRNRREHDHFGINGYVLMLAGVSSLIILYFQFNP